MPLFRSADEATRNSMTAVVLCLLGTAVGISASLLFSETSILHLPMTTFLVSLFGVLSGYWLLRWDRPNFDPSTTFISYLLTLGAASWGIRFFFADPQLGPFSEQSCGLPLGLENAAFGIVLFSLIGMVVGLTYYAARQSYGEFSMRRVLYAFVGVGLPLFLLMKTEYLVASFHP